MSKSFMSYHRFVTRLTRRVSLVEQKMPTLPEYLSSPSVISGVRVTQPLVLCVRFCLSLFVPLSFFLLAIVLSVLLRYTDSDHPFGIFKLLSLPVDCCFSELTL